LKLGVPTLCRYDLLQRLLDLAERGTLKPSGYVIVDNGGEARARLRLPPNTELIEPGRNLGVAASWNLLLEAAGNEPIVISNDDVALGSSDFGRIADAALKHPLVTALGWALFAQSPACTRAVDWYDEGFWPAYFEDQDYSYRVRLCRVPRRDIAVSATHERSATMAVARNISSEASALYYRAKWGGAVGAEGFTEPFGGSPPAGWGLRTPAWTAPKKRSIHDYIYGR